MTPATALLGPDEPPAVSVVNPAGRASVVLLCDHASARVPRALGDLGLDEAARLDHIGWDIGAAAVARRMSARLDAPLLLSGYSRLVIDCNRPLAAPTSIPAVSCGVAIPGNADVTAEQARARADACFWPYHRAVTALLDARQAAGHATLIVSVHSFTPAPLHGRTRPWHCGLLYGRDRRLAGAFVDVLRAMDAALVVGDNEPYQVTDDGDYGIPVYAERRGLPGALIEVRQDLVGDDAGAEQWAARLSEACRQVEARVG